MTSKQVALAIAALVGAAAAASLAQNGGLQDGAAPASGPGIIAVVDIVRIFSDCKQIKDLNEKMRQDSEDYANEARRRREQLDNRQIELRAFKPGTADYETRRKDFVRMSIEANTWAKVKEEDMERQKFDWTVVIYGKAVDVAAAIAKERGFDVVLQTSEFKPSEMLDQDVGTLRRFIQQRAVLYNVPQIDITDQVIRRLNDEYKAAGKKPPTTNREASPPPNP